MTVKEIPLSRGKVALVNAEDFEWLNQWKWSYSPTGYAVRCSGRRMLLMHRVILDAASGFEVDHINHNKLNNCRDNLRIATRAQNNGNRIKQANTTSRFKGVTWYKASQCWQAAIHRNDKPIYLGRFTDEVEAAKAYDRAARELFGEFAFTNFQE